ncbi:MAG: hypothetical protein IJV26_06415 [Lachnospiraceae bacterium]|nr:hypothetical protein [Lachnospiraceae bacterium]
MFHVIVNPASQSGNAAQIRAHYKTLFSSSGKPFEVHFSEKKGDITRICRELSLQAAKQQSQLSEQEEPADPMCLVIVGGDGTMNEAVNGIADFSAVRVGFLLSGSGNDLGRDLYAGADPDEVLKTILKGEVVRCIDVGEVMYHDDDPSSAGPDAAAGSVHRFNISCGIGYDALSCYYADHSGLKVFLNHIHLGKLVYLLSAMRSLAACPLTNADLVFNPDSPDAFTDSVSRFLLAVGMNHQYQGGGFRFCPDASNCDGQLDVCVAGSFRKLSFFRIFPGINKGRHLKEKGIYIKRAASVRIRTAIPLCVHTDGEVERKSADLTLRMIPGALRLLH